MKKILQALDRLMESILSKSAELVFRYPKQITLLHSLFFIISACITIFWLKTDFDRDNLVGPNKKYHQLYLQYKKEFPVTDDIVVLVESEDREKNRQFVERLAKKLESETTLFTNVFYKGDPVMMGKKALLFIPESDLQGLYDQLKDYKPFLTQFTKATNFASLFSIINHQFRTAKREKNSENESLINALPALGRILYMGRDSLKRPGAPVSPGVFALFGASQEAESQMYITFSNGRIYLVTAQVITPSLNEPAIEKLRSFVQQVSLEVPGINVGITGSPILEYDEMVQSQKDSVLASIVALLLCALIFIYGYQETGRPLKATFCLVIGLVYTLGFTTLTIGHLNILTITFVPILIGLAIDFGVHLITRYEEELRFGHTEKEALQKAMVFTGKGIVTGCLTTAGAFIAMSITNFKGIQEMGLICGFGMLLCLFVMLTLLPVLLLKGKQNLIDHQVVNEKNLRQYVEEFWLKKPLTVVALFTVLTAIFLYFTRFVGFDYNLLNMQSHGLPAVEYEKKLINSTPKSVLFAAVVAKDLNEAIELEKRLTNLPSVASVESMAGFLAGDQKKKLELVGKIKESLSDVNFAPVDTNLVDVWELSRVLWSFRGYLGLALEEIDPKEKDLIKTIQDLRDEIQEFRKVILGGDQPKISYKLSEYQQAFFNDLRNTFDIIKNQDNSAPLSPDDFPAPLKNRFIGRTGKFLLQVYPKENVWDRDKQERFVKELRNVFPNVTGTPVQLYEYTNLLKQSYEQAAWYALIAIVILVFIHFRKPECIVLALLPVGFGFLWMIGLMGIAGVQFNPANIMTLPLVIGIGVTNGIQILNRFAEEHTPAILSKSTGKAIIVSGLTTIVGFGSLMLGKHQGIISLGYVMSIGVAACMVIALTLLPALLTILIKNGWKMRHIQQQDPAVKQKQLTGSGGTVI
ncbi:MAG: MMPL family transporter [Verrucomicrobiia bacterium]